MTGVPEAMLMGCSNPEEMMRTATAQNYDPGYATYTPRPSAFITQKALNSTLRPMLAESTHTTEYFPITTPSVVGTVYNIPKYESLIGGMPIFDPVPSTPPKTPDADIYKALALGFLSGDLEIEEVLTKDGDSVRKLKITDKQVKAGNEAMESLEYDPKTCTWSLQLLKVNYG